MTSTPPTDCERFPFEEIPRKIFLDTNIVDCLVKWGECIFERQQPPADIDDTLYLDILSLADIFLVGSRANWSIVISPKTLEELLNTRDDWLRERLVAYGHEIANYATSNGLRREDDLHASDLARRVIDSSLFSALPQIDDRELIIHAIAFGCDAFCTRDRRSIHRRRHKLPALPLKIITPSEWWQHIRPWAALWI